MKLFLFFFCLCLSSIEGRPLKSSVELVEALKNSKEGTTLELAPGTFVLKSPLDLTSGLTLKGAGMDRTIITADPSWQPSTKSLPDPEMKTKGLDTSAYLIRLAPKAKDISLSGLTLTAPNLHGAIYGFGNTDLDLHHLRIKDVLWSGIRTFAIQRVRIHDCEFIDAGGRWGIPGVKGGITGGGIFAIWMKDCEVSHNRFTRTQTGKENEFYGIKVRQSKRSRFHHNTIEVNFSMEFPFENDEDNEIDHNVCHGTLSIPKYAGGAVPESGKTFHIHHNLMLDTYSIEFVRNGVEIDHNLFDFPTAKDHGNLISGFGRAPAKGPALIHNNLIKNPGRGVIWINEPYNQITFRNNHVVTNATSTPRTEGLFGFNKKCDFSTFVFENNHIECRGQARPLFRNDESAGATLRNNLLINITDTARYKNPGTEAKPGLEAPLRFNCGVHGETTVDGWKVNPAIR